MMQLCHCSYKAATDNADGPGLVPRKLCLRTLNIILLLIFFNNIKMEKTVLACGWAKTDDSGLCVTFGP